MSSPPGDVATELELRLVVPGSMSLSVRAGLCYETADPYAVHVTFHTGSPGAVRWTFARQLLTDGVTIRSGEGDVSVWPARSGGRPVVCLSLRSPSGAALFEAPLDSLVEFLTNTYAVVPTGSENLYVDLDAELSRLLQPEVDW